VNNIQKHTNHSRKESA